MRILFDSRKTEYKRPFGCLRPGELCCLQVEIPDTAAAIGAECVICYADGKEAYRVPMFPGKREGAYCSYTGMFSLEFPNLYFYYFYIRKADGGFRLFKQGNGTNMEAGDLWQVSCIPADFTTPDWAKGAVIYQVFPDRFYKAGECDLTGKLEPYTIHKAWDEEVHWQPTEQGEVLNNDFYGGNFRGITEKMDYIASLGVSILYLNPIGKSFSSHRYDTGDYKEPDPMLGTLEDFKAMCDAAHSRGIKIILDGVYSHTGANSRYFDKYGTFGGEGAYCSKESPYYSWFRFREYPDKYDCWWDFDTLPTVNKLDPAFVEYIITGEASVLAHWLSWGADGFRLDVVDELPNEFVELLKRHLRKLKPDALLIGEVWEDASNKIAYGIRRRYFTKGVLDSVMNYPWQKAMLKFFRGEDEGNALAEAVMTLQENYPVQVLNCNMNLLGTHDTPRILTALVDDFDGTREELSRRFLTEEQKALAIQRLKLASVLQYALPGCPSIYYGDEAGVEGHKDPFNRRTYPWGQENEELLTHYRYLGGLRKRYEALRLGEISFFHSCDGRLGITRKTKTQTLTIYINHNATPWELPERNLTVAPMGWAFLEG
ncbi:MAG: glycoside hydrolase family 13 protein [Oscillospiraceae bacterium]|nr:glycoside hydrolase family 13 protein [Oscillospiraceae bacterium]